MRALIAAFLMLRVVPHALADISDSGGMTIGGQAVIGGTMTVQGNSFSVGGTTFSLSGTTLTISGALGASSRGIQWADGSVSTTAATGGGANPLAMLVNSTDTVSGAKTFLSSTTLNPLTFSNICEGGGILVASGVFNGQFDTVIQSPILTSSRTFHLDYVFVATNAIASAQVTFNQTAGRNYAEMQQIYGPTPQMYGGSQRYGTLFAFGLGLDGGTVSDTDFITAGTPESGRCTFHTVQASPAIVEGFCDAFFDSNVGGCTTGDMCAMHSMIRADIPSGELSRIDICSNSKAPNTQAPDCKTPLNSGHWTLCAQGWRDSP